MIHVIYPSRGLCHSRSIESLLKALYVASEPYEIYFSHNNPIPDCFNKPFEEIKRRGFSYTDVVMTVEDDVVLNPDTIKNMLHKLNEYEIVASDYTLRNGESCFKTYNGVTVGGLGCMMTTFEVAEELFPMSSETSYSLPSLSPFPALPGTYGQNDIDFFVRAQHKGYKVLVMEKVKHLDVTQLGARDVNNGVHEIKEL